MNAPTGTTTKAVSLLNDGLHGLASLLYPPVCFLTDQPISSGILSAQAKQQLLINHDDPTCRRCGANVGLHLQAGPCNLCRHDRWNFDEVVALGKYDNTIRDAVLQLKQLKGRPLASALADMLIESRSVRFAEFNPTLVTAVPLHWRRRWTRGYNQAEDIAQRVAIRLRIPFNGRLVHKAKATPPQHLLNPTERRRNLADAFVPFHHRMAPGDRVILVDDVLTTGRTCDRVAKVLRHLGAEAVLVAVIARAGD